MISVRREGGREREEGGRDRREGEREGGEREEEEERERERERRMRRRRRERQGAWVRGRSTNIHKSRTGEQVTVSHQDCRQRQQNRDRRQVSALKATVQQPQHVL